MKKEDYERYLGRKASRREFRVKTKEIEKDYGRLGSAAKILEKTYQETRNSMKLACFSETPECVPMWAHYSGHDGICIQYEVCLDDPLFPSLPQRDLLPPLQVIYSDIRPKISAVDIKRFASRDRGPDFGDAELERVFSALYLSKSSDWSYEREWRVFSEEPPASSYCHVPMLRAKSIIFGISVDKVRAVELAERYSKFVSFRIASASRERFGFDFSDF